MVPPDAFHGSIDTDCAHYPTLSGMNDAAATGEEDDGIGSQLFRQGLEAVARCIFGLTRLTPVRCKSALTRRFNVTARARFQAARYYSAGSVCPLAARPLSPGAPMQAFT